MRLTFAFLFLLTNIVFAQSDQRFWYFGDGSGLDFSSNPPTVLTNGAIFTYDNSSTISDSVGQLLFYTNGVTIWNNQHVVMTNGSGLNGSNSGGQSVLILRQPGTLLYFVFTVPEFANGGCYYSIVDMAASGGLGAVTSKNNLLFTNSTEKLAAYYNCSNNSFWLVAHKFGTNQFYAYEVSNSGINLTPTISAVGNVHSGGTYGYAHDAVGQMAISPDGNTLVTAQNYNQVVQIFDFDKTTGLVSNPFSFPLTNAWGLAISPNNNLLYCTQWTTNTVSQIDITNHAALGPLTTIGTTSGAFGGYGAGYMELAPNGKILIAKYGASTLSSINSPNTLGIGCGFVDNSINLNGITSQAGLSRAGYISKKTYSLSTNINCRNVDILLNGADITTNATWDLGDGTTFSGYQTNHQYPDTGTYTITAIIPNCGSSDTVTQTIHLNAQLPTLTIQTDCQLSASFNIQSDSLLNVNWNTGDGFTTSSLNFNHTYLNPGTYPIQVIFTDSSGCVDTLLSSIQIQPMTTASFTMPDSICGLTISPQNSSTGTLYHWDFGDSNTSALTNPTHTYSIPGTYTIILIADTASCADTITHQITLLNEPLANCTLTPDCSLGMTIQNLSTNSTGYSWNWGNGTTATGLQTGYTYTATGPYQVTLIVSNAAYCFDTLMQSININQTPITNFTYPTPLCQGPVQFTSTGQIANQYAWTFGDGGVSSLASPSNNYITSGTFNVTMIASNGNCADTNTVQLTINPTPVAQFSDSSACDYLHYLDAIGLNLSQNTFFWYFGDGDSSILANDQHLYPNSGTFNVSLIVTSLAGCRDTITQPIIVRTKAIADFTPQVPTCGLQVTLINNSTNSNSSVWDFGDGTFSNLTQPNHNYQNGGNYTITLIADTGNCSDSTIAAFTLNEFPIAEFEFSGGCNDTISFIDLSNGAINYQWNFGDGDSSSLSDPIHIYTSLGLFPVELIVSTAAGCTDTISQNITVSNAPSPLIAVFVDSCKQKVYFTNSFDSLSVLQWFFGDGKSSFGNSVTHEYSDTGVYQVMLIRDPNTPCADTAYTSITIIPGETTPVFIPNCFTPNNDNINDRFSFGRVASCAIYHLQIFNRWGQKILDTYDVEKGWDGTFNNEVSPEGVYAFLVSGSVEVQGFVTLLR